MPTDVHSTQVFIVDAAHNRCFTELITAQAGITYLFGPLGDPYKSPDATISQTCFAEDVELEYFPADALGPLRRYEWPISMRLRFHRHGAEKPRMSEPDAVRRIWGSFYQQSFITYFEMNRAAMTRRYGDVRDWPETLRFGRVVRNAFAHGGRVTISDGLNASWRSVEYAVKDNGRYVLYNDLTAGDVSVLMLDMDELIGPPGQ